MSKKTKQLKSFNYRVYILLIIILTIIIILLLINSCNNKKILKPTGNIDIFDLKCNSATCPTCQTCTTPQEPDNTSGVFGRSDNSENSETSHIVEPNLEEEQSGFFAADNKNIWNTDANLRIFTHPAYVAEGKIAPGVGNTYVFRVRNNNLFDVSYDITFHEENNKNINIKYRLKKGYNYIKGSDTIWVSYADLNLSSININSNSFDEYVLDWKWIESKNDTEIGINPTDFYKISINIVGVES